MVLHGGLNQEEESFEDTWVLVGLGHKLDKLQSEMTHQLEPSFAQLYNYRGRRQAAQLEQIETQQYLKWV